MCSAPQYTHILTAQTPLSKNTATFLKTISFWDTLYMLGIMAYCTDTKVSAVQYQVKSSLTYFEIFYQHQYIKT